VRWFRWCADDGPDNDVGRAEVQQGAPDIVVDGDNPVGARRDHDGNDGGV